MRLNCSGNKEISINKLRQWFCNAVRSSPEEVIRTQPQVVSQILKNNAGLLTVWMSGQEWQCVLIDFYFSKLVGGHKDLAGLFTHSIYDPVSPCRLGPYVLRSVAGTGSEGCVYGTEDGYCLKVVPFSKKGKLEKEYKILRDFKHKNIIECYDFIYGTGYAAIVLERLKPELGCAFSYIRGLDYCHSQGILHGDIRLKNLGSDLSGNSKLFDFGDAVYTCSDAEKRREMDFLKKVIFSPIARERKVKYHPGGVLC